MDNENELNELNELNPPVMDGYTKIPTFKLWVANRFPYMETDFDALTNYELMNALVDYLNNVIKNEETVESNVAKLNQAYLELFNYVKDYFNNLDVQEEINNKLDDLVEDGTLTRLIGEYVQPLINDQNQEISNFKTQVNEQIAQQNAQIQAVESGSPLVANSVAGMTDTSKVYVNTSDGKWYYYNGTQWVAGGVYQATGIADGSVDFSSLTTNLKDSTVFYKENFYGNYDNLASSTNRSIGTQEGTGYYNITRNKPLDFSGYITKFFVKVYNSGHKGNLVLQRLSYENNVLNVIENDTETYEVSYNSENNGYNEITLSTPFKVEAGDYIGYTVTPTTESPYPTGYCNMATVYPTTDFNYGLICTKKEDNTTYTLNTMVPCFDFEITSSEKLIYSEDIQNSWLYGKKWMAYGDSITAGYNLPNHSADEKHDHNNLVNTYVKLVANKYNMEFHNWASSGRGYSNSADEYNAYSIIESYHISGDTMDLVTIAFGTNDYGTLNEDNQVVFGTVADDSTQNTFCAKVKRAFDKLNEYYPSAVIVVMLPIPRKNLDNNNIMGKNLIDYCEAIKTIAKYYGFYVMNCIEIARSNVKSTTWQNAYMLDNVHMTESYHRKYYAPMVEEQLKIATINE